MDKAFDVHYLIREKGYGIDELANNAFVGGDQILWAATQQYIVAKQAFMSRLQELYDAERYGDD